MQAISLYRAADELAPLLDTIDEDGCIPLFSAPPTQAIAVEAVQKPKIGERWFVKIKGAQTCHELLVCDLTVKTISLREEKPLIYSPIMRYVIADIELIEIAAPSQGAKQ